MKDKVYDFAYLGSGLEELENYLLSDEIFWPVTGSPPGGSSSFQKLTLGNLLLSLKRLSAYAAGSSHLTAAENAQFTRIETQVDAMQQKWQVAWHKKAGLEFVSRFNQWIHTLNELTKERDRNAPYYANEVRLRVLLELLSPYTGESQRYDLAPLDAVLGKLLASGPFIWDAELEPGFPAETFWYLYGTIRE